MAMRIGKAVYRFLAVYMLLLVTLSASAQQERKEHIIEKGETLYRISLNYGVTIEEICRLNPNAAHGIRVGEKLLIPVKATSDNIQNKKDPIYHKVEAGETLYSIARAYGVSVNAIISANYAISNADKLSQGIIIVIPPVTSESGVYRSEGSKPSSAGNKGGITGLIAYKVPAGATVYSLLQMTGWSEEQLYHYNPQIKNGLKANATILIPDSSLANNQALGSRPAFPITDGYTVVLALPFSSDKGQRFSMYYEGFLMALLDAKKSGMSIHLHAIDCSDQKLQSSISTLSSLPKIDMIFGGVSDISIEKLSQLAKSKGSTYIIPFTSKVYPYVANRNAKIYQVNTPHKALYRKVAQKFIQEYRNSFIQFVRSSNDRNSKDDFISTLKEELEKYKISYSEMDLALFSNLNTVSDVSGKNAQVIVVPDVSSLSATKSLLGTLNAARDSLLITNIIPFGYPEWQTYAHSLGNDLKANRAVFYTTFFADSESNTYRNIEGQFSKWFNHGLGTTYPRYSLLGYDTASYFLALLASNNKATDRTWNGIQSKFEFTSKLGNEEYKSNLGVFFVQYQARGEVRRF